MNYSDIDTADRIDVLLIAAKNLAYALSVAADHPNGATAEFTSDSASSIGELINEAMRLRATCGSHHL